MVFDAGDFTFFDIMFDIVNWNYYRKELKRSKQFEFVNHIEGLTPQQISLAYILRNPNITSASFNTLSIDHLRDNVMATDIEITPDLLKKIDAIR